MKLISRCSWRLPWNKNYFTARVTVKKKKVEKNSLVTKTTKGQSEKEIKKRRTEINIGRPFCILMIIRFLTYSLFNIP